VISSRGGPTFSFDVRGEHVDTTSPPGSLGTVETIRSSQPTLARQPDRVPHVSIARSADLTRAIIPTMHARCRTRVPAKCWTSEPDRPAA
jgi:hypothetical protein